jgi:hypothetical protein
VNLLRERALFHPSIDGARGNAKRLAQVASAEQESIVKSDIAA